MIVKVLIHREKVEGGYNIKFTYIVLMKSTTDDMVTASIVTCTIAF